MMEFFPVLIIGFYIYVVITIILLLLDNREPGETMAWVFVFITLPVIGVILYILFGRNWRRITKKAKLSGQFLEEQLQPMLEPIVSRHKSLISDLEKRIGSSYKKKLFRLLQNNSNSILTFNNTVQILQNGDEKFKYLMEDLEDARESIHMEYFIWRSDNLTQKIKNILIRKAREGVEVRILFDSIGSIFLPKSYKKDLREAGVQIYAYFNFLSLFKFHTLNYRNHRKIVVVDGAVAYTGGMNMAREYVDGGKRFAMWRDTHMRLTGEVVLVLQGVFATSWYNTTKERLFTKKYFLEKYSPAVTIPIQFATSGPDSQWASIQQLFFGLIASADQKVYIQTPYFIPDPSMYMAIKTAALSGVDVRLVIAGVADKKLPYYAAFTYFEDLLKAGVRIFHYTKGFMHAKAVIVDSEICSVGTANMDVRSFHLNYELSGVIYDSEISSQLENDFLKDIQDSKELTLSKYKSLRPIKKFRNSLARLLAPLL